MKVLSNQHPHVLPKGSQVINVNFGSIKFYMEFEDYDVYVIQRYPINADPDTWSFSILHEAPTSRFFVSVYNTYEYPEDDQYVGTLTVGSENFLHNFYAEYYRLVITTPGDYTFHYESAPIDATVWIDIFTLDDNYIGSLGDNDMTVHLEPGTYVIAFDSNWALQGIFKLVITKD